MRRANAAASSLVLLLAACARAAGSPTVGAPVTIVLGDADTLPPPLEATTVPPPAPQDLMVDDPDGHAVTIQVLVPPPPQQGAHEAQDGERVGVLYTGMLTDGTVFDSTDAHGKQPFDFRLDGSVIPGFHDGILGMRLGEKRRVRIPPALAYGERGAPKKILKRATLVFDIELVELDGQTLYGPVDAGP